MLSIFAGPIFFITAVSLLTLGLAFLALLWRQGWILVAIGLVAMGLAIPGWLTVVGVVAGAGGIVTYVVWSRKGLGRSL